MTSKHTHLPYVGIVKAGFPTFEEQGNNLLSLEEYLVENVHASFMTHMKTDTLSCIGILKGDMLIIEKRARLNAGDIAVVMADGHHRFLIADMHQGKMLLRSVETDAVYSGTVQVVGIVKGVIRKY